MANRVSFPGEDFTNRHTDRPQAAKSAAGALLERTRSSGSYMQGVEGGVKSRDIIRFLWQRNLERRTGGGGVGAVNQ